MDEERLNLLESNFEHATSPYELHWDQNDYREVIRLARLGLWARKNCIVIACEEIQRACELIGPALAALPKGPDNAA